MKKWGLTIIIALFAISAIPGSGQYLASEPPTFTRDIQPILDPNCYDCHGFNIWKWMATYESIMAYVSDIEPTRGIPIVYPSKPDSSVLIWRLEGRLPSGEEINYMPSGFDPLDADTIQMIREWIRNGAPDDPVEVQSNTTWGEVKSMFRDTGNK